MEKKKRRYFPDEFKRQAVERVATSGLAIIDVAAELGIHESQLRRWIRQINGPGTGSARHPITQAQTPSPADLAAENARLKRELQKAQTERDILKKAGAHLRSGHPMTFGFVDEHRHLWPVRTICAVLGISASGYYAWRGRSESRRSVENRALLDNIRCAHAESGGCYGAPRIHAVLRAAGRRVGRHRVARLMRLDGLRGLAAIPRRVRTTDSRHDYPIAPNRLRRAFMASAPNQVWLADLTYIRTGEGWLFLAALIDMHTRKVVGWSMRETLHAEIVLEALEMAIQRQRPAPGLIHHSDRGVQYAADEYRQALAAAKITPSMSRKGNCLDNAPMESFFHTLKIERVHHRVYATRDEARRDLFACIEGFYNSRRLHSGIGYRSPADMERMAA
ncbi:IS3 family transposase, partial [Rhodobacteraceae bacterium CCMM004]